MGLEKSVIKAQLAETSTFEYKPREIGGEAPSGVARAFVSEQAFQTTDFKISDLVAAQAGISQLEDDAHQDKINEQVMAKLGEVQEKSYQEGYALGVIEGTEKGFQDAKAALLEKLTGFEKILKRIEELKVQLLEENEAELVKLVFLIAKKMALRDVEGNREVVFEMVRNVVREGQEGERVNVRLAPQDLQFIETLQQKGDQKMESLKRVKFIAEEKVKPGGCIIETDFGDVDATLEERVERTWAALQAKIPHSDPQKKI